MAALSKAKLGGIGLPSWLTKSLEDVYKEKYGGRYPGLAENVAAGVGTGLKAIGLPKHIAETAGRNITSLVEDWTPAGALTATEEYGPLGALAAVPMVGAKGKRVVKGLVKAVEEHLPNVEKTAAAVVDPVAPKGLGAPKVKGERHPVSANVLRRPFKEMTATYAPGPPLLPMKEADLEGIPMGSWMVGLLGDRTQGGRFLTGVNDLPFDNPVELQAGSDFLRRAENPDEAFWASDPVVNANYEEKIFGPLQKTGDPIYAMHVAMGSEAGDYSRQTTKALLEKIRKQPLSQEAKDYIDDAMRTQWGGLGPPGKSGKQPKPKFVAYPDWPGVDNITDEYLTTAGSARTKFAKLLDTSKVGGLGGPDVGAVRKAVTHPELLDAPTLATGHRIVRVGPEAVRTITDPKIPHHDYASQLVSKGTTFEGGVKPIPGVLFWQDWFGKQKPGLDAARLQRSAQTQGLIQRKTPEWWENLQKFKMSDEGKKLGLAGAIAAGLITSSEAEELFGYDGET